MEKQSWEKIHMNLSSAAFGGILKLNEIAYAAKYRPIFKIPYYQRPYEWDREHIENLISDFIKNKATGTSPEYFVGATVLVTNKRNELEVVDGQQRVTTMYLLNMLRFMIQRAVVNFDLINSRHLNDVSKDINDLLEQYGHLVGEVHLNEIKQMVDTVNDKIGTWNDAAFNGKADIARTALDEAVETYNGCVGISFKSMTDSDYVKECQDNARTFWKNEKLSIIYSRDTFNKKLKEALSLLVISLDTTGKLIFCLSEKDLADIATNDEIIGQYVKSIYYEFNAIKEEVEKTGVHGKQYTLAFLNLIKEMIDKIEFCAVVTGSEKDAYALFESLNDRNKAVDDLDLIKNLYLRAYYTKSGEDELYLENGLDEIDKIWNDYIFTKQNRSTISLLGAVYLTGDCLIDEKNGLGVRKTIDSYLDDKNVYELQDVCNDIKIYKMVREIINTSSKANYNSNKSLLIAENEMSLSITYRCLFLLRALNYTNVLSGLVNVIIASYLDGKTGDIDINDFKSNFLNGLMQAGKQNEAEYREINNIAFDLWRLTIAGEDHKKPREYAIDLIQSYHKGSKAYVAVSNRLISEAQGEFDKWLRNWHYGMGGKDIRIKTLFINLLKTSIDKSIREITLNAPTAISLTKPENSELDHLEPKDPDPAFSADAYFQAPIGKTREEIVDGLGNFMLLDDYTNIKKNNCPICQSMNYYDVMLNGNIHWLVEEIKGDINDNSLFDDSAGHRIPKEDFFVVRRSRLISYFEAIVKSPSYDTKKVKY